MVKRSKMMLLFVAVLAAIISVSCVVTACNMQFISVTFVVDGEDVDKVDAADVTNFEMPENPVKTGYEFDGWYLDKDVWEQPFDNSYFTNNELSESIKVYAKWSIVNYDIVYELNGGQNSENNPETYTVEDSVVLAPAEREGYTFEGWYVGEEKVTEIVKGNVGNVTLSAAWTVNTYTINYELDGGENSDLNPDGYNTESETIVLQPAQKKGYKFVGWYVGEKEITEITKGSVGNLTLTAAWEIENYKLTYELNGGQNSEDNPATYSVEDSIILAPAEREGYKFEGWYSDGEKVTEIVKGSVGNLTLSAAWTLNTYTITYQLNGGENSGLNPADYNTESETIVLQPAQKKGYKFVGWYVGENVITEITKGSVGNLTLTAAWEIENYKLTYELNGGSFVEDNPSDYNVESQTIVLKPAEKNGYIFMGWFSGEDAVTEIKSGTVGNITLSAKWIAEVYTITYQLDGGDNSDENPASYTIESETISLQPAQKKNYIFAGWYMGNELVEEIVSGSVGEITLTAKWIGNLGTELAPYQISDANSFKTISSGTADKINYYVLTDDIYFAESDFVSNYYVLESTVEYVSIDGDGHNISADAHMDSNDGVKHTFVFNYTGNEVVIENLDLKMDSYDGFFTLVFCAGRDDGYGNLTLRNIDVVSSSEDVVVSGDLYNNAPYIYYPNSGKIDFVDCDNYVNFNSTLSDRYYAVYLGAYEYIKGMKISFTDCDNYGDVRGAGYVAMFVGNAVNSSRENHAEYTVENCYNYGVIQGGKGAALFSVNTVSDYFSELNDKYTFEVNKGYIGKLELNNFTYTVNENGYVEYSVGETAEIAEVELTLGVSIQYFDSDGTMIATGSSVLRHRVAVEGSEGVFDKYKVGRFIDKDTYDALGLDVELGADNLVSEYNSMSIYNIEVDGNVYYVVVSNTETVIKVNATATVYVAAYGSDGSVLGQAVKI